MNNSSFKRKVVVSFASCPLTGHKNNTQPASCNDMSVENLGPRTPCNSSRRVMAGHTPGYIPRGIPNSAASESRESTFSESAVASDEELDEQMSNLVASFTASPGSPERAAPLTPKVPADSDIFSTAASAKGKPPSRANEISSPVAATRVHSSKAIRQSEHTPQNESATPSTLFYSSSDSEGVSESKFMESRMSGDCDVDDRCVERSPNVTPCAAPTIVSQPASLFDKPTFLASPTEQTTSAKTAEQSLDTHLVASPLDFSQPIEPDFCKSIGLEVPHLRDQQGIVMLDYNTEFTTVPTRNVESAAPAERHRGSSLVPSFSCIGSPGHSVPKLSKSKHERIERKHVEKDEIIDQISVVPQAIQLVGHASQQKAQEQTTVALAEVPTGDLCIVSPDIRNKAIPSKEVSLSRPGIRRAHSDRSTSIVAAGACISEVERNKSVPFMMASPTVHVDGATGGTNTHLPSTAVLPRNDESPPDECPQTCQTNQTVCNDPEVKAVVPEQHFNEVIDIDTLCDEAIKELYCDQNSLLSCNADALIDADATTLGLHDVMGTTGDQIVPQCARPKTIEKNTLRSRQTTPSTCSSGAWSLGTTMACRVPGSRNGRYCRDDDDDAPVYFRDDYDDVAYMPEFMKRCIDSKEARDNSFSSQNTMTTVAIDDDMYGDNTADGDNFAQLCLTSRPWMQNESAGMHRNKNSGQAEDVKEILLFGEVGYTTSISISFRNKRSRGTVLQAKAILHRFEPTVPTIAEQLPPPVGTFRAISDNADDDGGAINVAPDNKVTITVEFSPFSEGVYSGVLKIRSKKKVNVCLFEQIYLADKILL